MPRRHKEGLLPFKVVPIEEPLVARSGLLLPDGNIPAQAGVVSFIEKCFEAMPDGKSITYLRGDSALYQAIATNRQESDFYHPNSEVETLSNSRSCGQACPSTIAQTSSPRG